MELSEMSLEEGEIKDEEEKANGESKFENEDTISDDLNELKEIVNIRSECSIHQEFANRLDKLSKEMKNESKTLTPLTQMTSNLTSKDTESLPQIGEIEPSENVLKKKCTVEPFSTSRERTGIFNMATGSLNLEEYLKREAEIASKSKMLQKSNKKPKILTNKNSEHSSRQKTNQINNKKIHRKHEKKKAADSHTDKMTTPDFSLISKTPPKVSENSLSNDEKKQQNEDECTSGSEYIPSENEYSDEDIKRPLKRKKGKINFSHHRKKRILDDGDESLFRKRLKHGKFDGNSLRTVENLFKVPKIIWSKLYEYQKVSVRWLWELHNRNLGGLIGDEMGLGKTIQVIAFLAGLDCSELLSDNGRFRGLGPTLIVCPATLLEQWVQHFHNWWPSLRVVTLHASGTHKGEPDELLESLKIGGILLTSYSGVLIHDELLISYQWHYVILDEGHKIRNPQAKVTKVIKKFSTPHRLLLTGSPMQNSLNELWSLFDFILPGKLGTLEAFMEHCALPITRGGYTNASALQEATALQVATMLKDAISPYILRRTKNDVNKYINLPGKNEQVLFCSLTQEQTDLYKEFLRSEHVYTVLHDKSSVGDKSYRGKLLVALTTLRKICNHPDLHAYENDDDVEPNADSDAELNLNEDVNLEKFGNWKKSGKMRVVRSLLKIWKNQGHRVLIFTQSRQMLHILESLVQRENYTYLRLDGSTPMVERQKTINTFNQDNSYLVFISTTRVGGLGINLTGADRVIIYDPDWNPATDAQAKERVWRIGQDKNVTIYRLITVGTIEEKIYHRQIYKLLLSNKILDDPRQRRFFQTSDLTELFNLNDSVDGTTSESDRLFCHSNIKKSNLMSGTNSGETKKKRNRGRQNVSTLFEGEEISCLVGRRLGTSDGDNKSIVDDDNYVLKKLFSKTTVSSVMEHDTILSSAKVDSNTVIPMQKLAQEAAKQSMECVRQSRKWCKRPLWNINEYG